MEGPKSGAYQVGDNYYVKMDDGATYAATWHSHLKRFTLTSPSFPKAGKYHRKVQHKKEGVFETNDPRLRDGMPNVCPPGGALCISIKETMPIRRSAESEEPFFIPEGSALVASKAAEKGTSNVHGLFRPNGGNGDAVFTNAYAVKTPEDTWDIAIREDNVVWGARSGKSTAGWENMTPAQRRAYTTEIAASIPRGATRANFYTQMQSGSFKDPAWVDVHRRALEKAKSLPGLPGASGKANSQLFEVELVSCRLSKRSVEMAGTCAGGQVLYRAAQPDDAVSPLAINPRDPWGLRAGQRISQPEGFSADKNFALWFGESYSTVSELGQNKRVVLRGQMVNLPQRAGDPVSGGIPVTYKSEFDFDVLAQQGIFFHGRANTPVTGFSGNLHAGLATAPSAIRSGKYSGKYFGVMALEEMQADGTVILRHFYGLQASPLGQSQARIRMRATLGDDEQSQAIMSELRRLHDGSLHANNLANAYGGDHLNRALAQIRQEMKLAPLEDKFEYIVTDTDASEAWMFVSTTERMASLDQGNGLAYFFSNFVNPRSRLRYSAARYRSINADDMNNRLNVRRRILLATSIDNMKARLSATDIAFSNGVDFKVALERLNILDLNESQRRLFVLYMKRADSTIVDNPALLNRLAAIGDSVPRMIYDAEAFARWGATERDLGNAMTERLIYLSNRVDSAFRLGESNGQASTVVVGRATDPRLRDLTFVGENQRLHQAAGTSRPLQPRYTSPGGNQAQNHAEQHLLNQFNDVIEAAGIDKRSVTGNLNIMVDNPTGVCGSCKAGLGESGAAPGVIVQASRDYPNLTFTFITRFRNAQNAVAPFSVKNGVRLLHWRL
jgi:hypothetical protein